MTVEYYMPENLLRLRGLKIFFKVRPINITVHLKAIFPVNKFFLFFLN